VTVTAYIARFVMILIVSIAAGACTLQDRYEERTSPVAKQPSVVLESPRRDTVVPWGAEIGIRALVKDVERPVVEFGANAHDAAVPLAEIGLAAEASGTAAGLVRVEFVIDGAPAGVRTTAATQPQSIVRFNHHGSLRQAATQSLLVRSMRKAGSD